MSFRVPGGDSRRGAVLLELDEDPPMGEFQKL